MSFLGAEAMLAGPALKHVRWDLCIPAEVSGVVPEVVSLVWTKYNEPICLE